MIKTNEIVAVKVLGLESGEANLEDIRHEINILRDCNHPNIVKYYGSYHHNNNLWVRLDVL